MNEFRVLLATVIFTVSSYLVYDLITKGFNWITLLSCVFGFLFVHFIWPKHVEGETAWYDFLEIVVDLPFRSIAFFLRSLGRLLKSSDGDIGIDL